MAVCIIWIIKLIIPMMILQAIGPIALIGPKIIFLILISIMILPAISWVLILLTGYHLDRSQFPGALFLPAIETGGVRGTTHEGDSGTTSDSHFDVTPHLNFDLGDSQGEFFMPIYIGTQSVDRMAFSAVLKP